MTDTVEVPATGDVAPPRSHPAEAAGCRRPGVRRSGPGRGIRRSDLRARRLHPRRVLLELRDQGRAVPRAGRHGSRASGSTSVRERVAQLESDGDLRDVPVDALAIVQQVLDVSADDRLGDPAHERDPHPRAARPAARAPRTSRRTTRCATASRRSSTTSRRAKSLRFRMPADEAARLMLTVWEGASVRGAMAGLDYEEMCRRTSERARARRAARSSSSPLSGSAARSARQWQRRDPRPPPVLPIVGCRMLRRAARRRA